MVDIGKTGTLKWGRGTILAVVMLQAVYREEKFATAP